MAVGGLTPEATPVRAETAALVQELGRLARRSPPVDAGRARPPASSSTAPVPAAAPASRRRGDSGVPQALGRLVVNAHLHTADAAERLVVINMRRYREGERTREGALVERITAVGVEMRFEGQPFLLPSR
jgi:hypothetical protein